MSPSTMPRCSVLGKYGHCAALCTWVVLGHAFWGAFFISMPRLTQDAVQTPPLNHSLLWFNDITWLLARSTRHQPIAEIDYQSCLIRSGVVQSAFQKKDRKECSPQAHSQLSVPLPTFPISTGCKVYWDSCLCKWKMPVKNQFSKNWTVKHYFLCPGPLNSHRMTVYFSRITPGEV